MAVADDFFMDPASINDAGARRWPHESSSAPDANDPLVRLMDTCESATDSYANALHLFTAAEIAYQKAWDDAYRKSRVTVKSNAEAERLADALVRDLWAAKKECEASEKEWDKRLRAVLARLSAMQTVARGIQGQT